uniref:U1 small nuclear ribonucleoprotein 70 kDa n=1 Tax=Aegilops tauschii subsp. strangulata TaxID=200361 RepID=A0A452YIZ7_AEGTS
MLRPSPRARLGLKRRIEFVNLSLRKVQLRLLKSSRSTTHKMTPMSLEIHTKHSLLHDLATRHPSRRLKGTLKLMGLLKGVRLITDKVTNKPRGYAFVEYAHTRDMKSAYKQADGRKVDNKRVLVDVERGRTVPNWRPRRLGGGLGSSRIGGEDAAQKHSAREQQNAAGRPRSEEPRRDDRPADR